MAASSASMRQFICRPTVPSKIICVHLNYSSQGGRNDVIAAAGANVLSQASISAQRTRVGGRQTTRLQVVEL